MQKNQRARIERDAKVITQVAFKLAVIESNQEALLNSDIELSCRWSGKRGSEAIVHGEHAKLDLALHEAYGHPNRRDEYYYSESTQLARRVLPCGFLSERGVLCALIAHEMAHAVLFLSDSKYGTRPHNRVWIELTAYLRSRLIGIFDFNVDTYHQLYIQGNDVVNLDWPLVKSYWHHHSRYSKEGLSFISFLSMLRGLVERLITKEQSNGLVFLSQSLLLPLCYENR